jgi:UDP-glucose 4-epimerase
VRCAEDFAALPRGPYDRIYHLAASFANELSLRNPQLDFRTNVEGTRHTLDFAERAGCGLFVYTGTSSSYGDAPVPFVEDGPMHPGTPYARNKRLAEDYVRASRLRAAVFRLFNVYGPGEHPGEHRNAIAAMFCDATRPDGHIRIFGPGATRDFTYIDDVVDLLLAADAAAGAVVNIGTGRELPIEELATRVLTVLDLPRERIRHLPPRPWDWVVRRVASVDRLVATFGRKPETSIDVGLRETARWLGELGYLRRSAP